jgi:subtilisin
VFAAGRRWAIANRMQVINLSFSTDKRDYFALFHELVDEAYFANVVLVCAVNNVPGPTGRVGAPGIDIEAPWLGGSTIKATGNSFAAPHIAGLVNRILGNHSA